MQGKNQKRIIIALSERPKSPAELALELHKGQTASHLEAVRKVLRRLAKDGLVEQCRGKFASDGTRCWQLAEGVEVPEPQPRSRHLRPV